MGSIHLRRRPTYKGRQGVATTKGDGREGSPPHAHTDRHTSPGINRQILRQTDRQVDRQTHLSWDNIQRDRQTDSHTHKQTDR